MAAANPAETPIPLMEMLEKQVPYMMIHGLAQRMGDDLATGLYQMQNADNRHRTLRAIGGALAVGLSIGVIELGLSVADPALAGSEPLALGGATMYIKPIAPPTLMLFTKRH